MDDYFDNNYTTNGNNVYRINGIFICRMVQSYECTKCVHLSKSIVESDVHFRQFHEKNPKTINNNNNLVLYQHKNYNNLNLKDNNVINKESNVVHNQNEPKIIFKTFGKNTKKQPKVIIKNDGKNIKINDRLIDKKSLVFIRKTVKSDNEIIVPNVTEDDIFPERVVPNFEKEISKGIVGEKSQTICCKKFNIKSIHLTDNQIILNDFKPFGQINCVSKLKTYSRKKFTTNDSEVIDDSFADNQVKEEEEEDKSVDLIVRSNLLKCEYCDEIYTINNMRRHVGLHLNPHICDVPFCDEKFATETQLESHKKTHEEKVCVPKTSEKPYKCDLCDSKFVTEKGRQIHRNIHTNPKICDFPDCNKKFSINSKLEKHKLTHNKDYIYKCLICNKAFPYLHRLKEHKNFHTNPVFCDFKDCNKKFTSNSIMKVHRKSHFNDRPYACDEKDCKYRAKHPYYVKLHKRLVHIESKAIKCEWNGCEKMFKNALNMKNHVRCVHKEIKNFICEWPECEHKYYNSNTLAIHLRIHTGEKPFVCDHQNCGKRFRSQEVLSRHKTKHLSQKPYNCDLCGSDFSYKASLNTHKKLTHNWYWIKRRHLDNNT